MSKAAWWMWWAAVAASMAHALLGHYEQSSLFVAASLVIVALSRRE